MNKRKTELSLLNITYCFLVILIHCVGGAVVGLPKDSPWYIIFYSVWSLSSFVVQGFIFLSAVKLFMKESTKTYPEFLLSKAKVILLPYVLWCLIYYLSYVLAGSYKFDAIALVKGIFTGSIAGHFYYIVILMQFFLLLPLWKKLFRRENALIVLPATVVISTLAVQGMPTIINVMLPNFNFIYNDRLFTTYLVYWTLGAYVGLYYEEFKAVLTKNKVFISTMFLTGGLGVVCLPYIAERQAVSMFFISDMQILYSIMAILFTFMLADRTAKVKSEMPKLLGDVDKATYTVYLCHCLFLFVVDAYVVGGFGLSPLIATAVRIILVYPLSIFFSIIWEKVISKIKNPNLF